MTEPVRVLDVVFAKQAGECSLDFGGVEDMPKLRRMRENVISQVRSPLHHQVELPRDRLMEFARERCFHLDVAVGYVFPNLLVIEEKEFFPGIRHVSALRP